MKRFREVLRERNEWLTFIVSLCSESLFKASQSRIQLSSSKNNCSSFDLRMIELLAFQSPLNHLLKRHKTRIKLSQAVSRVNIKYYVVTVAFTY